MPLIVASRLLGGVLAGSRQNERKIGKNELEIDFKMGFLMSFLFLVVSYAQYLEA